MGYISVEWIDIPLWGSSDKAMAVKEEALPYMCLLRPSPHVSVSQSGSATHGH